MLERKQREDGSYELGRPKLTAENRNFYTVTQRTINELKDQRTSYQDAREAHDGYLASWRERGRFQRDGKQWVIVQDGFYEYAVEIEITANGGIGEVIPVPPERAYELARAADGPNVIQDCDASFGEGER